MLSALLPADQSGNLQFTARHGKDSSMPNILNIAIRAFDTDGDMSDNDWRTAFLKLVDSVSAEIHKRGIRRVTFLVCRKVDRASPRVRAILN